MANPQSSRPAPPPQPPTLPPPPANTSPGGGVWAELAGQSEAIGVMRAAAAAARLPAGDPNANHMTQSWLFTGAPGSGRSVAALTFAAALQCDDPNRPGCGRCPSCIQTMHGEHPDVTVLATDQVVISIEEVRALLDVAYTRPTHGKWRVIIVEDYDRISENASNCLLKAIEEPPENVVWILCAPSSRAVLPTIRSRCRVLQMRIPPMSAVEELLVRRDGADARVAREAAREAQGHIGYARALARDPQLRQNRLRNIHRAATVATSADAVNCAEALLKAASTQAEATQAAQAEAEEAALRAAYGLSATDRISPKIKSAFDQLAKKQENRAKRSKFDALDRLLQDLASFYRDVLLLQFGAHVEPFNAPLQDLIDYVARHSTPPVTLRRLDAISQARLRLGPGASPQLILEGLFATTGVLSA